MLSLLIEFPIALIIRKIPIFTITYLSLDRKGGGGGGGGGGYCGLGSLNLGSLWEGVGAKILWPEQKKKKPLQAQFRNIFYDF